MPEFSKTCSSLMKDINRIKKTADAQIKINILRKHQLKLLGKFLQSLIEEGRIKKGELKPYTPKKKEAAKILFEK